ncbi:MAG: FG-GAP-like repeat-containing protein [Terriglobales bacterium]
MSIPRDFRGLRALLGMLLVLMTAQAAVAQPSATNTALTLSSNSVTTGTAVTLTASATSGTTAVTAGQVVFCNASATYCEGPAILGSAWMITSGTSAGTATIHKTFGPGTYSIEAIFQGTNSYAASTSSTASLTVSGPLPTTTTINATGVAGNYALNGTVWAGGTVAPTGSVSFFDATNSNSLLASVPLTSGIETTGFAFASTSSPATTSKNQGIAVGDFKHNGNLDYVVASLSTGTATVMLGNGTGAFTAQPTTYSAGSNPEAAVVADFNGDGNLDIAFADSATSGVTVLLGNGDGTFTSPASLPALGYGSAIAVGDFNGDGIPDLAVSNNNSAVTILLGNGDGTFTVGPSATVPSWSLNPEGIVAMDFNGDGKLDLAVTSSNTNSPANYVVTILLGNGDGTFTVGNSYPTGNDDQSMVGGDFNGDGIPDLAIANYYDDTVTILLGNNNGQGQGAGTFTPATGSPVPTGAGPFAIVAGDFNNDGKLDLATANFYANTVTFLLGNGDGTFAAASSTPTAGGAPDGIAAGDFNGDGLLDLVTANYQATTQSVLIQSTSSTILTAAGLTVPGTDNVFAQYSGDTNFSSSQSVTVPLSSIIVLPQTINFPNPGPQALGTPLTLSASATSGLPVSFTVISGPATLSGSTLLTFTGLGSVTIQAAQGGNGSYAAATPVSQTFTVNPASQTITFPNPGTLPDGVAPVTLTATASSGLPVTYTLISGPATLSGSTLTVTGTGSIVVEADQAGNADYAAAPSVQITITVVEGQFTLSPPTVGTTITAGQQVTIPVTVWVVNGFAGSMSFTCTPPAAMLGAACSASPVQITGNTPMTANVIVNTTAGSQSSSSSWPSFWHARTLGIAFAAVLMASGGGRRKKWSEAMPLVVLMIVMLLALVSCGGSGSSTTAGPGTPAGSYSLTLVGTSGNSSYTAPLSVTVN